MSQWTYQGPTHRSADRNHTVLAWYRDLDIHHRPAGPALFITTSTTHSWIGTVEEFHESFAPKGPDSFQAPQLQSLFRRQLKPKGY